MMQGFCDALVEIFARLDIRYGETSTATVAAA
jgi:hypothetical protein